MRVAANDTSLAHSVANNHREKTRETQISRGRTLCNKKEIKKSQYDIIVKTYGDDLIFTRYVRTKGSRQLWDVFGLMWETNNVKLILTRRTKNKSISRIFATFETHLLARIVQRTTNSTEVNLASELIREACYIITTDAAIAKIFETPKSPISVVSKRGAMVGEVVDYQITFKTWLDVESASNPRIKFLVDQLDGTNAYIVMGERL
jgi:hypothetical protein